MPTQSQTEELARTIVLAQGNDFIKELLRSHGLPIGTTKADFEKYLLEAIRDATLTHAHIEEWLREVEGWGNQTIYPYRLSTTSARDPFWKSEAEVKRVLKRSGLPIDKLWGVDSSLKFPSSPTLTGIYFDANVGVQFVWHMGNEIWKRDTSKDYETDIDGDHYQFKASRQLARRTLIRCEIRPADRLAVIFVQLPGEEDHSGIIKTVARVTKPVADLSDARRYSISDSIKGLDGLALTGKPATRKVHSRNLGLLASGATVTFASAGTSSYQNVAAVRRVRNSVNPNEFAGQHGNFTLVLDGADGKSIDVLVHLHGEKYRGHVRSQLTREQVWAAIAHICQF
jgi:hypothetical protein